MIRITDTQFETWKPDFSSSGQDDPTWTRAFDGDVLFCNSLEGVEWDDRPVQVVICGSCGTPACASGHYVHISRLGSHVVLWTPPQIDSPDAFERDQYTTLGHVERHGSVVFSFDEWTRWHDRIGAVPTPEKFPPANGRTLADAWRLTVSGPLRVDDLSDLPSRLEEHAMASDTMEVEEAISRVKSLCAWLSEAWEREVRERIHTVSELGVSIETLYTDGSRDWDWPAFAVLDSRSVPAFGKDYVFVPEEGS